MKKDHYQAALDAAVDAALEAGKLIRDDFHRPGGPRDQDASPFGG